MPSFVGVGIEVVALDEHTEDVLEGEVGLLDAVVPLFAVDSVVNRAKWRVREEDFFWVCDDDDGWRDGIWAGDGSCCSSAVYGFRGFAGRGGEDDAVVAGWGSGGFG
jgi:hypothetical protein